jgi:hypothetical protein
MRPAIRPALFLVSVLLAGDAVAAAQPAFLFDALQGRSAYRTAWERLMKLVQPTPDWLVQFNKNYDGVAGQMTPVTIDGKAYELSFVCKPSDCEGHRFAVLFDPGAAHAFGALGGKDNSPAYFGSPSKAEQDAISKAVAK